MIKVVVVNPEKYTGNLEYVPPEQTELETLLNEGYKIIDKTIVPTSTSVASSAIGGYKSLGSVIYILEKE